MFDFKIVELENGRFDYDLSFEKTSSFAQRVLLVLNTWKTEFSYHQEAGLDYLSIFRGKYKSEAIESFFILSLNENLEDFEKLTEFKLTYSNNKKIAYVTFLVFSKNGESHYVENYEL